LKTMDLFDLKSFAAPEAGDYAAAFGAKVDRKKHVPGHFRQSQLRLLRTVCS
jgi:hypothetical protein